MPFDQLERRSSGCSSVAPSRERSSTAAPCRRWLPKRRTSRLDSPHSFATSSSAPTRAQLAGDDGYRFRHLLIRDAAYDALPKTIPRRPAPTASPPGSTQQGDALVERGRDRRLPPRAGRALPRRARRGGPRLADRAAARLATAGQTRTLAVRQPAQPTCFFGARPRSRNDQTCISSLISRGTSRVTRARDGDAHG